MKTAVVLGGVGVAALAAYALRGNKSPTAPSPSPGGGHGGGPATPDHSSALDHALATGDCQGAVDAYNALLDAGSEPSAAQVQAFFASCGSAVVDAALADPSVDCATLQNYIAQLVAAGVEPTDAQWSAYTDTRGCDPPEAVQQTQAQLEAQDYYRQAQALYQQAAAIAASVPGFSALLGSTFGPADDTQAQALDMYLQLVSEADALKKHADELLAGASGK